jgi:DUF177 domain-containing protein
MQQVKIPLTIDPKRASKMHSEYLGIIEAKHLPRLMETSAGFCSDIQVQFSCDTDKQGLVTLTGHAKGELSLNCQRCMCEFNHPMVVKFSYTPVNEKTQDEELPEVYEPVDVDEHGLINICELIEDELLVSIPFIPMHAIEECSVKEQDTVVGEIDDIVDERPNPFAVLKSLKK